MLKKSSILTIAFLEGFCVILIELASGRIVAPIFGTALQVWAGVLGITLLGLAAGYFLGSRLNFGNKNTLVYLIGSAALYVAIFTFFSESILVYFSNLNYELGLILSLLSSLFVPLTLLGAVSPFLSDRLSVINGKAGKATGIVFSISTFGGIAGAFLTGFYLIPQLGIVNSMYTAAIILSIIVGLIVVFQSVNRKPIAITSILIFIALCINQLTFNSHLYRYDALQLKYENENMLSQLRVMDVSTQQRNGDDLTFRMMMVNNTLQAIVDANNPSEDYLQFNRILAPIILEYFKDKKVLILGLGGGVIANLFVENGCDVDVVELDSRIEGLARQFFGLSNNVNVIIEDARRFVKHSNQKYDVIFIDTFHGESIPSHIFTQEALVEMKLLLNKEGILISNFHGFTDEKRGQGTAAVYKTLQSVGFESQLLVSNTNADEMRSLLFFSSASGFQRFSNMSQLEVKNLTYASGFDGTMDKFTIDSSVLKTDEAPILTDDKQQLDYLMKEVSLEWRKFCYDQFVSMNNSAHLPLVR
jgi:spermidine synthase